MLHVSRQCFGKTLTRQNNAKHTTDELRIFLTNLTCYLFNSGLEKATHMDLLGQLLGHTHAYGKLFQARGKLVLKIITSALEGDHLWDLPLFFHLLSPLLVSRVLQRRLILQVSAVERPHFDSGSEVLLHLALTVPLEVLHGAAEDAAAALRGQGAHSRKISKLSPMQDIGQM